MAIAVSTSTEIHVHSHVAPNVALAVRTGLTSTPKRLPPWLLYDETGSRLFEEITALPEYYLTRTERSILCQHGDAMIARAAEGARLRIAELGAGSADKTRILLTSTVARQRTVTYEPVDVSATALLVAQARIEREIPGVRVAPLVMDYTNGFVLDPIEPGERRLVLYIGSSIGNFERHEAAHLLKKVRAQLTPGDGLLLGIDLVKDESILSAAYDDATGTTAAFNKNILTRLNREFAADFDPEAFAHRAVWNEARSRIEMHLVSRSRQRVRLNALDLNAPGFDALDLDVEFEPGESIHTENSYKYRPGEAEAMLTEAGFTSAGCWTDPRNWFAVYLGRAD